MRKTVMVTLAAALLAALAAGPAMAQQRGGVIDIATIGEPPTLDPRVTTNYFVGTITQHMLETLFTFDANMRVVPLLAAAMPEISADGKIYDIRLREGVKFHDGTDMDAEDAVASVRNWLQLASRGKLVAGQVESVEQVDRHHMRIVLKAPSATLLSLLALNISAAVILPAEKQGTPLGAPVGTGPYRLKEHRPDQYIQLVRNDDYANPPGPTNGYSGERKQYLDEIRFVPVPDANTRIEGSIAGQYHFADALPIEALPRLQGQPGVVPLLQEPAGWAVFVLNKRMGITADNKIARAIRAALNMEDMLAAAFGDPQSWKLNGAMFPESQVFYTEAGVAGNYNIADPEAAKALLAEAGYSGQPLRILTSRQYEFHYKMAQVAVEYLKAAGFTVDLQVFDWATQGERRNNPELWDIYITHGPLLPEPGLINLLSSSAAGGWATEARARAMDAFMTEVNPDKRVALWGEVQKVIAEDIPFIKIGDFNGLFAKSARLQDIEAIDWPFFWNAWLSQ